MLDTFIFEQYWLIINIKIIILGNLTTFNHQFWDQILPTNDDHFFEGDKDYACYAKPNQWVLARLFVLTK
jgi:hypothetical protein